MTTIVRAFPVLAGKEDAARTFAEDVGHSRRGETAAFLSAFGVQRESWHLQRTPQGTFIIVVTEVADPHDVHAQAYGASQGRFERWFKDNVRALCGVDADAQPLGPPTETIFSWSR